MRSISLWTPISSLDEQTLDTVLVVISNVPHLFQGDSEFGKEMKELLSTVCLEGTGSQARKAIRAIAKGYSAKTARTVLTKLTAVRLE